MKTRQTLVLSGCLLALSPLCGRDAVETGTTVRYVPYRFEPGEGWTLTTSSNAGATRLEGRTLHFDFTRGATQLSLTLPDRSLLTLPERFRFRLRGDARQHPVHVFLRTHFMTFDKVVGQFVGNGEQELVFDAPPGPGWQWSRGENDGKIHGPLRVGEIRFEANDKPDQGTLELLDLAVEGRCPSNKLCVISAEQPAMPGSSVFRVTICSLASQPLRGSLHWAVRDWDGRELKRGHQSVLLRTNGEPLVLEFPVPQLPREVRLAEAQFELKVPGQDVPAVQAYWLAPTPGRPDAKLQPESPFGMGIYLGRYSLKEMEGIARLARDAGAKWSREGFSWSRIEPRPGEFHWEYFDGLLDCASRNGISIYGLVSGWAPWAKAYTAEGVEQYAAFLRQLVGHYKGRILHWEIWNEPNIFFWQGPREMYGELLKKSYATIKEVDPAAQVLGISTAGIDFAFIDKMLKLGAPFDVLTIHPYRKRLDDRAFIDDLQKVAEQVKLSDGTPRPVWLTEMGWTANVPHHVLRQDFEPVTQRAQAQLLARVYLCSLVSGIQPLTFWYDFRDDGSDPFYFEHNLGTLRQDTRPKPAYLAFATLTRLLEGTKLDGQIDAGAGVLAFRLRSAKPEGGYVLALWNPQSDSPAELRLPAKRVRIINTIGETGERDTRPAPGDRSSRLLRLDLKAGAPVYVTWP